MTAEQQELVMVILELDEQLSTLRSDRRRWRCCRRGAIVKLCVDHRNLCAANLHRTGMTTHVMAAHLHYSCNTIGDWITAGKKLRRRKADRP